MLNYNFLDNFKNPTDRQYKILKQRKKLFLPNYLSITVGHIYTPFKKVIVPSLACGSMAFIHVTNVEWFLDIFALHFQTGFGCCIYLNIFFISKSVLFIITSKQIEIICNQFTMQSVM